MVSGNDQSHANPDGKPMALCVTEPVISLRYPRRWFFRAARDHAGHRQRRGPALWTHSVGVAVMGGSAKDTAALCDKMDGCLTVTLAAGSIVSRNTDPALLLRPLRELGGGVQKRMAVSFLTRAPDPLRLPSAPKNTNDAFRWNAFRALQRAGVAAEFPTGLSALPGFSNTSHPWEQRSTNGGTICEWTEATELHRPYVMNLCFENAELPDYVTEKIVNSFLAGAIPVYWGTADVRRYFNERAFIFAHDFVSLDDLAAHVARVMSDCHLRDQYLSEPPCSEEQLRRLLWWRKERWRTTVLPPVPC
eukprot:TRINITY_DN4896_c1_g2_i3.p1 TRINITY_DN4896_c1_g2~~TRINITY_DN4896_c1_g2_i3.p1  ORF type:complete len:305 (+),score=83.92 TRINITY_DN4896_c1_g2_i3:637-1551(+)